MIRRTAREWGGLAALFLTAGAVVAFGVLVIGSVLGLPLWALAVAVLIVLTLVAVPVTRLAPRAKPDTSPTKGTDDE
jgi:membrane protein implicated in regulation of membrane protease activity